MSFTEVVRLAKLKRKMELSSIRGVLGWIMKYPISYHQVVNTKKEWNGLSIPLTALYYVYFIISKYYVVNLLATCD